MLMWCNKEDYVCAQLVVIYFNQLDPRPLEAFGKVKRKRKMQQVRDQLEATRVRKDAEGPGLKRSDKRRKRDVHVEMQDAEQATQKQGPRSENVKAQKVPFVKEHTNEHMSRLLQMATTTKLMPLPHEANEVQVPKAAPRHAHGVTVHSYGAAFFFVASHTGAMHA